MKWLAELVKPLVRAPLAAAPILVLLAAAALLLVGEVQASKLCELFSNQQTLTPPQ